MDGRVKVICIVTVIVILASLLLKVEEKWTDMTYVTASDGHSYRVRNLPDKARAADLLSSTRGKLFTACDILKQRSGSDSRVQRLLDRFIHTDLAEADGNEKNTSYSINKGEKIVLCLRQKDGTNRMVDQNLVLFVALHEISHIMTRSIGHTDEFWNNFKFVLKHCQDAGLYKCQDFSTNPQKYCGIVVSNSPLPCSK